MWDSIASVTIQSATNLKDALLILLLPASCFAAIAIFTKGVRPAWAAAKRAIDETGINLNIYILDTLAVQPMLVLLYTLMAGFADTTGFRLVGSGFWDSLPSSVVALAAVIAGDFIGYWRHRLEHTRFLWPSHAVQQSDTAMTWLALLRFHPFNRLSTSIIDYSFLLLLGFPAYALLVYNFVKHYYGFFIHADLTWSYGRWAHIFVSPAMHRWHHSIETEAYQTNFATVFSIFDRMFGTYLVPEFPPGKLGVKSDIGNGVWAQLLYPFRPSAYGGTQRASHKSGSLGDIGNELHSAELHQAANPAKGSTG